MNKIKAGLLGISIRQRLIAYFLLAILIPTLFIAAFQYRRSTRRIEIELNQFAQQNLENAEVAITQKLNLVNDLMTLTNINKSLQDIFLDAPPDTLEGAIQEMSEIENILSGYFISSNYLSVGAGVWPRIYMENRECYNQVRYDARIAAVHNTGQISRTTWYPELTNQFTLIGLEMNGGRRGTPVITVARKLFNTRESMDSVSVAAVMVLEIETASFAGLLEPYRNTAGGELYVTDAAGTVLLCTDSHYLGRQLPIPVRDSLRGTMRFAELGGEEYMINTHVVPSMNGMIYSSVPMKEINGELKALDTVYVVILVLCMLFALMTALVLSDRISRPIRQLVDSMEHVYSDKGFVTAIDYRQKDEFGYLIGKYQEMIRQIQELIEKLYISDLNQKDAQLKAKHAELVALQAKINPHFLYNALDSIHMYALKYEIPQISVMVAALADFYRFSLSKGRDIITVEEELNIIQNYFILQKMRLGEMFDYQIDVPEEITQCLIVKFTLQPLVENAIEHGIEPHFPDTGRIVINGWLENHQLIMEVSDSSSPSSNEHHADVEAINTMLISDADQVPSFGIRNVNERIHNFFGEAYGLSYRANEQSGVTVRLCLPVYRTMGGYYAKNGNRR